MISQLRALRADDIIVLATNEFMPEMFNFTTSLAELPAGIHIVPVEAPNALASSQIAEFDNLHTIQVQQPPLSMFDLCAKRAFDFTVATIALIALSPLLPIVAIAIRLDSPGPIFFRNTRHGFNNNKINVLKFRSMTSIEDAGQFTQATKNDPRITRIGQIIRRTNIDELPQLINVLHGEMSLVGPRPHATAHNALFNDVRRRGQPACRRVVEVIAVAGYGELSRRVRVADRGRQVDPRQGSRGLLQAMSWALCRPTRASSTARVELGQLAVGLASLGLDVVAADASDGMVRRTEKLASEQGVSLRALRASWDELPDHLEDSHVRSGVLRRQLARARRGRSWPLDRTDRDVAAAAIRGGRLVLTSRNWELVRCHRLTGRHPRSTHPPQRPRCGRQLLLAHRAALGAGALPRDRGRPDRAGWGGASLLGAVVHLALPVRGPRRGVGECRSQGRDHHVRPSHRRVHGGRRESPCKRRLTARLSAEEEFAEDPARKVRLVSEQFYTDARLYDRLFPGGDQAVDFYRAEADRQGGRVLELGSGTGHKLIPIASDGHPCLGLELSSDMLGRGSAQGGRARRAGGVGAGRHARVRPGPHVRPRVHRRQLLAASACGRGPGAVLPLGAQAPGARSAVRLRRVQPERAHARRGRRRTTHGARRCRSWIPIVASCTSMSPRPTTRPRK